MVLGYSVKGDSKVKKFLCDFLGGELAPLRGASGRCAARSAASGKRKRPPAQRKIFGFHNPALRVHRERDEVVVERREQRAARDEAAAGLGRGEENCAASGEHCCVEVEAEKNFEP